jgi:heme exporter protein D
MWPHPYYAGETIVAVTCLALIGSVVFVIRRIHRKRLKREADEVEREFQSNEASAEDWAKSVLKIKKP